ncbi:hypothetical protein HMPREF1155_0411 [Slackia sp. CM382]|nr:hypothetical protein HMPREF1155_0411 [Slackia sp. CM382]
MGRSVWRNIGPWDEAWDEAYGETWGHGRNVERSVGRSIGLWLYDETQDYRLKGG